MPNFAIALSGLESDNTALNTIANNLSNMSTTAYKAQTTNFADMFYESIGASGSGNPIQEGTGTQVASISTDTSQGDYDTTGKSTSQMAIDGEGYFVVDDANGAQYLTRDGNFTENTDGHLETTNGDALMGYQATNGQITGSTLSELTLPTKGSVMPASASANIAITANLNSGSDEGDTFSSTVKVYDSLGQSYDATVTYTKSATPNEWKYSVSMPNSDFVPPNPLPTNYDKDGTTVLSSGIMEFDPSSGNLMQIGRSATTLATVGVPTETNPDLVDSVAIKMSGKTGLADGATLGTVSWNLLNSTNGTTLTQTAADSSNTSAIADGYTAGTYQSFAVGGDGTVTATYSNGQTETVGQVALGTVANDQGLTAEGGGLYKASNISGTATVGTPGTGTLGSIRDSALEDSNVDISTEFSQLIIAQRAFEANSKSVTTFDSVTQTAINMIH
jgi:flagellar hook protein FlgE